MPGTSALLPPLLMIGLITGAATSWAQEQEHVRGHLVFHDGHVLEVEEFVELLNQGMSSGSIFVTYEGVEQEVFYRDIEEITVIGAERGPYGCILDEDSTIFLRLRDGQEVTVSPGREYHPAHVTVRFIASLTGQLQEEEWLILPRECIGEGHEGNVVQSIVFDEDIGTMSWSTCSERYFPGSFNFDPYTGERLIHRTPEESE